MTGFQLSWKIEPPPINIALNQLGTIQTPGWLSNTRAKDSYSINQAYIGTLSLPDKAMVGNGSLVIQLELGNRRVDGWHENVSTSKGGLVKYALFTRKKSWHKAEAYLSR